jgi:uncharacterized protein (TIGR02452 family)
MQNTSEYWNNRVTKKEIAKKHTKEMSEKYNSEIKKAIANTTVYDENHVFDCCPKSYPNDIIILDKDSVSAIFSADKGDHLAVLNFASYKSPGGKFLEGSSAQEESLCHESFLYNVISQFPHYYENNNKAKNKALYLNRALYSKNIVFERNGMTRECDVITCAAPNLTAAKKYCNVSDNLNTETLINRCDFLLNILVEQKTETIILGAFGCGVFGQNPEEVANIFKDLILKKYNGVFKRIIFAIPSGSNGNLDAFRKVF